MIGLIFGFEYYMGWLTFKGFAWDYQSTLEVISHSLLYFMGFTLVGWNEELLSRGYHLQNIANGIDLKWAVFISSIIFSLLHIYNPHANWISFIGIFFAGVFLASGYIQTKQLWLPIGLHIGWNFFEGVVFGFPVSGTETYKLIIAEVNGPELWTGGLFGPEAGIVILPALAIGILLVFMYSQKRESTGNKVS
jgi:membrane protease YdiL (CAAX protease family)